MEFNIKFFGPIRLVCTEYLMYGMEHMNIKSISRYSFEIYAIPNLF